MIWQLGIDAALLVVLGVNLWQMRRLARARRNAERVLAEIRQHRDAVLLRKSLAEEGVTAPIVVASNGSSRLPMP